MIVQALWLVAAAVAAQGRAPETAPGWFGVFPSVQSFDRKFDAPKIDPRSPTYSQTARYEWTGGALRSFTLTLARQPRFKTLAEDLKKDDPKKVELGKHTGWFIAGKEEKGGRVLVSLGDDLGVEIVGVEGMGEERLLAVAKALDLEAVRKALAAPPRAKRVRDLESFRAVPKGSSYADLTDWMGEPDRDVGSGIHIVVWKLDDGTSVLAGSPDFRKVLYLKHTDKQGKTVDLWK